MAHVADRILAALKSRLALVPGIAGIYLKPLNLLEADQLPALVIDDIEDTPLSTVGRFPVEQTRQLKCAVQVCLIATEKDFDAQLITLHEATALALFGSLDAITLGQLLTRGLTEEGATLFTDSESIQQVVGGWRISVSCTYNLRSDSPGQTEKELS